MTIRQYIKKNGWENECELVPGYRYMIVHINFLNKNKAEIETSLDIKASDCRQSPRLFAEDFSVLKRLKVSIFKTFQSLFGIIKVSKKAVLFYDDTRNRKSKKANADGMY